MNGAWYFEGHPWDEACARLLKKEPAGQIAEVTVQCACGAQGIPGALKCWDARLNALLDSTVDESRLDTPGAALLMRRYESGAIARLFFDEGEDVSENFEIVSRNALILWRPDSSPQGHMLGKQAAFCDCAQVYSNGLEVL